MKKVGCILFYFCLLLIFGVSAGFLHYYTVTVPNENREAVCRLQTSFQSSDDGENIGTYIPEFKNKTKYETVIPNAGASILIDLSLLQKQYPDIKGWLLIPGTKINYPVLQGNVAEPEYYLYRDYKGSYNINGSLFLQWDCDVFESENLIIYGHNMNSGEMFGELDHYDSVEYWEEHPNVLIQTEEGCFSYQVVTVLKTDITRFSFQQTEFVSQEDVEKYLLDSKKQELFAIPESTDVLKRAERILTLVTCSYESDESRHIVVAVRI